MLIKIPKIVSKDGMIYRLYLDYTNDLKSAEWKWKVSYVGDNGFLETGVTPKISLQEVEIEILNWLKKNNIQTV